jgi:transposase
MKPVPDHEGDAVPEELPPVFPDPPDVEQTLARIRNRDYKNDLEWLELFGALFTDEESEAFVEWVHRERREYRERMRGVL